MKPNSYCLIFEFLSFSVFFSCEGAWILHRIIHYLSRLNLVAIKFTVKLSSFTGSWAGARFRLSPCCRAHRADIFSTSVHLLLAATVIILRIRRIGASAVEVVRDRSLSRADVPTRVKLPRVHDDVV